MILSLVLKLFGTKRPLEAEQIVVPAEPKQEQVDDRQSTIDALMGRYEEFLAKTGRVATSEVERTWETTQKNKVYVNADSSYLMLNPQGQIIKTGDVLRRLKEYKYEETTGELLVKKFGVWNTVKGQLSDKGNLVLQTADGEIHERLDGTLITISVGTKSLIAQNEHTGEEVALSLKGTLRHRYKKLGVDIFRLYENEKLITECESLEEPQNFTVQTMAENLRLECVNRIERKFENDQLVSESYTFLDTRSGCQAVRLCLNLPTGELHLSKVQRLENKFSNGVLTETSFELSEPVSVSRDKEGNVSLIRGISKVRRFEMHENVCAVVFIDGCGDENLFFPAI